MSVAYIRPQSRTERPRNTKIGTEVAHVTSHVTRTPLSRSKGQRTRSPGRFAHRRVGASGGCSGGRGNVLAVGNCCYVADCSAAQGALAPTGRRWAGHIVAAARLQLVFLYIGGYEKIMNWPIFLEISSIDWYACNTSSRLKHKDTNQVCRSLNAGNWTNVRKLFYPVPKTSLVSTLTSKFFNQRLFSVSFKQIQIFNQNAVFFYWTPCLQT